MNVIDAISEVLPSFLKSAKKTIKLEEISTLDKEKSVLISRCETLKTEVNKYFYILLYKIFMDN